MKRIIGLALSFGSYLSLAPLSFAQDVNLCPPGQFLSLCNLASGDFGRIISTVINLIFIIAIVIAVLYLVYGGIKWIMSGGDKSGVEAARNHITAAIVGLIVTFLAYFIINVLVGFFLGTGASISNLKLPSLGPTPTPTATPTPKGP